MVNTIIACADIHIRNFKRAEEYKEQLSKFIEECKDIVAKHDSPDEVRIVIAGDLFHNKLDISSEGYVFASWFLRQLDKICKTIIIAGNHDINIMNVTHRLDPLSALSSMCNFKQVIYLDKELGYQSGIYLDDNIVWCLYSAFDGFNKPNIESTKIEHLNEDKTYVALFHGELKNAKTDVGFVFENGLPTSYFDGIDFGILGHIHKRQCLKNNGVPLLYCGSLIQQDQGENVSSHGYVIWNVKEQTYDEKNIANEEYGFYTFTINSVDDIDNDNEVILNL